MFKFHKLVPALAVAVTLSPFAANAFVDHGTAQKSGYVASPAISSQVAVNSKGRPGEIDKVAVNSKGRPGEIDKVAVNSKGRPGEIDKVAANSKGRPGEFETPMG